MPKKATKVVKKVVKKIVNIVTKTIPKKVVRVAKAVITVQDQVKQIRAQVLEILPILDTIVEDLNSTGGVLIQGDDLDAILRGKAQLEKLLR